MKKQVNKYFKLRMVICNPIKSPLTLREESKQIFYSPTDFAPTDFAQQKYHKKM